MRLDALFYGILFMAMSLGTYFSKEYLKIYNMDLTIYSFSIGLFLFGIIMVFSSFSSTRQIKHEIKKSPKLEEAHKLAKDILMHGGESHAKEEPANKAPEHKESSDLKIKEY